MTGTTYQITVPGPRPFCAALVVLDGIVVEAAPILRRFKGLAWEDVRALLRFKYDDGSQIHVSWRAV